MALEVEQQNRALNASLEMRVSSHPAHGPQAASGYSATTIISRTPFGIGAKVPEAVLGDDVKPTIELDAVRQ